MTLHDNFITNNDNIYYIKNNNEKKYSNKDIIKYFINNKISDETFDDPFYIVNLKIIEDLYNRWIENLPNIKPYYAIKCNPNINIIKTLEKLGCNFDCASKEEIKTILDITNDEKRIIFANPCKSISHIKYAKNNNVSLITFDCIEELYKIKIHYPTAKIVLRLAVDDSKSLCQFNSKFGCKLDNTLIKIFKEIKELNMNLVGFSFHVGSGCYSADCYYTALKDCRYAYDIAKKEEYNFDIKMIDIGGGFYGINKKNSVNFDDIIKMIKKGQNDFFGDIIDDIEFIAEPGRYFTESSHTLVVNVTSKKREENTIKYYINDGAYGSFNCIHYDYQEPILIQLNTSSFSNKYNSIFFGPTCDSMDFIYKNIMYNELEIGDWLYIENFGSYTNAPGASFNGFKTTDIKYIYY